MNPVTRRSLIVSNIFGITVGLLIGILLYVAYGSLGVSLVSFAIFGVFMFLMSIISIPMGRYFHHREINKYNKAKVGNYDLRQENSVEVDLPYHQALNAAEEAINAITGSKLQMMGFTYTTTAKVHEVNSVEGTIKAGTKIYWRGIPANFMDDIRINIWVEQINSQTSRVIIDSKPSNPMQIFDYGYTLNNINTIMRYLRQASTEESAINHLSDNTSDETASTDSDTQKKARHE